MFVQILVMVRFLLISHFCRLFSHSAQPKDTPLRLMAFTQIPTLLRSPFKVHIYPSTCSYFHSLDFILFVINPYHQPIIESIIKKNILFAIVQSLVERKSNTTTTNLNNINLPSPKTREEKKNMMFSNPASYLAFHCLILHASIQCRNFYSHP